MIMVITPILTVKDGCHPVRLIVQQVVVKLKHVLMHHTLNISALIIVVQIHGCHHVNYTHLIATVSIKPALHIEEHYQLKIVLIIYLVAHIMVIMIMFHLALLQ